MLTEVLLVMAGLMLATVGQWIAFDQTAPFFQSFDTKVKHEWVNRMNSTVMTALITCFAAIQGYTSQWGSAVSIAYFLHDMAHMLLYESDITAYGHHIVSLAVTWLLKTEMLPHQAETVATSLAILESTSPLVNTTWLLNKAGYSDHPFFKYVAIAMAAWFGIQRVLVFPWLIATRADTPTKFLFSPLIALNIYWFYKIVILARKKLAVQSGTEKEI